MENCIVFAASDILDYDIIKPHINSEDFIICADAGLRHAKALNITPNLIIGDFDSMDEFCMPGVETIRLPSCKDDTDSMAAVREGLKRGYKQFAFFGVLGGRLDHMLANIFLLEFLRQNGASGVIYGDNETVFLIKNENFTLQKNDYSSFSLISLSENSTGVCIKGAQYELDNAVIDYGHQYGVCNEFSDDTVCISVENGTLLIIANM